MADTKSCPACHKDVPTLAVRCKYCGTRLEIPAIVSSPPPPASGAFITPPLGSLDALVGGTSHGRLTSSPAPRATKTSTPPPPPPSGALRRPSGAPPLPRPSNPPPPPTEAFRPSTPPSTPPLRPSVPVPRPSQPGGPSGLPRPRNSREDSLVDETMLGMPRLDDVTLPERPFAPKPAPLPRPSTAPRPPLEPRPSLPLDESLDISLSTEGSAITDVETLMERGQQRESTVEPAVWRADSSEIKIGLARAEARPEKDETPAFGMMAVLNRPVLANRTDALGRITLLHAGGAGFGLLTLFTVLALALSSSEDEPPTLDEPTASEVVEPSAVPDTAEGPAPGKADPAIAASPLVPPPSKAMEHKCRPLAKYPTFPWKDTLATILTTAMASGVCGLFGRDTQGLSEQIGPLAAAPATGYDLLPDGQILEVFPSNPAVRPGPNLSLLFGSAGLLELRLDYGDKAGKELNAEALKAVLGEPTPRVDEQGRRVDQFIDGDLIVEVLERRDKYRRVFRELRFSSRPLTEQLDKTGETRRKVEAMLARGQEQRGERRFADAKKTYEKVLGLAPNLGQARVGLGMLALPEERFDEVEKQALASLELSRDRRVQAEAKGLLAVVALFRGKGKDAWALFSEAAAMDPANGELLQSVRELETKKYAPERVAKTAARLRCLAKAKEKAQKKKKKKKGRTSLPPWTEAGLLARGNFPDRVTYDQALASVSDKREFKSAEKLWSSWECR